MRRLLVLTASFAVLGGLLQSSDTSANHAAISVITHVYHPVGNSTSAAQLNCGWHDVCDYVYTDASKKGLDWQYPGNVSYVVWLRLKMIRGGGGTTDYVGRAQSYNATSGCKRIWSDLLRVNGSYIGAVTNQHSQAVGTVYTNLFANGGGYQNEGAIGTMLRSGDNCMTSGAHTMQWYTNSTGGGLLKNVTQIPLESGCVLCGWQYNRWTTLEWLFTYLTAP